MVGLAKVGGVLSALAYGVDSSWPRDSPGVHIASQVRHHLLTVLGEKRAAAVLRGVARNGRLHPGLAPPHASEELVGAPDGPAFSSREALRKWVKDGPGDVEQRKKALL